MTRVGLNDATSSLSEYTRRDRTGPVVVTRHGEPVALPRLLTEDEWETFAVSSDPGFAAMMEGSRARYPAGTGIPLAVSRGPCGARAAVETLSPSGAAA
jgi:hypothetical protein